MIPVSRLLDFLEIPDNQNIQLSIMITLLP